LTLNTESLGSELISIQVVNDHVDGNK